MSLSKSIAEFDLDVYKELVKNAPEENMFYSPLSISLAFGMVSLGAKGKTLAEIEKTGNLIDIHKEFKGLLSLLNAPNEHYELSVANRLYGQKGFDFVPEFMAQTEDLYNAKLEAVDFQNNAEGARQTINLWVEKQTKEKIKELFAKGSIDDSTVMALANAIYFKGKWVKKFNKEATQDGIFKVNKNEKKTVKMMSQTGKFKLGVLPEMQCKMLELPYVGDLSMLIILPDKDDGLSEAEAKMIPGMMEKVIKSENLIVREVHVTIPRFKSETEYDLIPVLTAIGMNNLFTSEANLTGISIKKALTVSAAVHKAYVEVNEEGTEAAAATGIGISVTSMPIVDTFTTDHPFMYIIKHNPTQSILFQGRCMSPQA
ncbi:leukocyte elastase inhibitor-like [Pelodytes ibericus]